VNKKQFCQAIKLQRVHSLKVSQISPDVTVNLISFSCNAKSQQVNLTKVEGCFLFRGLDTAITSNPFSRKAHMTKMKVL